MSVVLQTPNMSTPVIAAAEPSKKRARGDAAVTVLIATFIHQHTDALPTTVFVEEGQLPDALRECLPVPEEGKIHMLQDVCTDHDLVRWYGGDEDRQEEIDQATRELRRQFAHKSPKPSSAAAMRIGWHLTYIR